MTCSWLSGRTIPIIGTQVSKNPIIGTLVSENLSSDTSSFERYLLLRTIPTHDAVCLSEHGPMVCQKPEDSEVD